MVLRSIIVREHDDIVTTSRGLVVCQVSGVVEEKVFCQEVMLGLVGPSVGTS